MRISVLYTGWLQERLRTSQDEVDVCDGMTLAELSTHLLGLGVNHQDVLGHQDSIFYSQAGRILRTSDRVEGDAPIIVFPPIAGG